MSKTAKDTTLAEYTARLYDECVDDIVARLHELADDFGRTARRPRGAGDHRHATAAAAGIDRITQGLVNVGAHRLIRRAAEADAAKREEAT